MMTIADIISGIVISLLGLIGSIVTIVYNKSVSKGIFDFYERLLGIKTPDWYIEITRYFVIIGCFVSIAIALFILYTLLQY